VDAEAGSRGGKSPAGSRVGRPVLRMPVSHPEAEAILLMQCNKCQYIRLIFLFPVALSKSRLISSKAFLYLTKPSVL